MKLNLKILIISIILISVSACNNSKLTQDEIEERTNKITEIINKDNISELKDWQFEYRGDGEIWSKLGETNRDFQAYYFKTEDSINMFILKRFLYSSDFPIQIFIDTSKFQHNFLFTKYKDGNVNITATEIDGNEIIINDNLTMEEIFGERNPFEKLETLSALKGRLNVYKIRSIKGGNFVEFIITSQDVLTYIPDKLEIEPMYEQFWLENFSKGKSIKNNWNLRKLENPISD